MHRSLRPYILHAAGLERDLEVLENGMLRSLPPIRRGSCSTYSWWWVGSCGEIPWVGRCLGPDSQYLFTFECDALVDLSVTVECRPRLDDGRQCHTQGTAVKTHTMTAWSANLKKSFKYTDIK